MKFFRSLLFPLVLLLALATIRAEDGPVFEMRTYYANEGKLDDLLTRFRPHRGSVQKAWHGERRLLCARRKPGQHPRLLPFLSEP